MQERAATDRVQQKKTWSIAQTKRDIVWKNADRCYFFWGFHQCLVFAKRLDSTEQYACLSTITHRGIDEQGLVNPRSLISVESGGKIPKSVFCLENAGNFLTLFLTKPL
ncbi:MAG: hypothetical protein AB3N13_10240 [Arenibacterium sp.]